MPSKINGSPSIDDNTYGPAALWLGVGILFTGLGTAFLGPILPQLAHNWNITDQQSGLLIAAKFVGAFFGGISVRRLLRHSVLAGHLLAFAGFGLFAASHGILLGTVGLFISGYGVGLAITAINILVGRRYVKHTGAALSTLNFFWSLGATMCGFLAAMLVPRFGLHGPMLTFAGLFLFAALGGSAFTSHKSSAVGSGEAQEPALMLGLPRIAYAHFASLLFLYGGLETCLTGWITTYSLRLGGEHRLGGQSAVVLLWAALTVGRALATGAMRYFSETAVQRGGLLLSSMLITGIITTQSGGMLSFYCLLLGLGLAPFFPSTFGILMRRRPHSQQAGIILAASGLGAALFPWLMGYVSTHIGSLRVAMAVPAGLTLLLVLMTFFPPRDRSAAMDKDAPFPLRAALQPPL